MSSSTSTSKRNSNSKTSDHDPKVVTSAVPPAAPEKVSKMPYWLTKTANKAGNLMNLITKSKRERENINNNNVSKSPNGRISNGPKKSDTNSNDTATATFEPKPRVSQTSESIPGTSGSKTNSKKENVARIPKETSNNNISIKKEKSAISALKKEVSAIKAMKKETSNISIKKDTSAISIKKETSNIGIKKEKSAINTIKKPETTSISKNSLTVPTNMIKLSVSRNSSKNSLVTASVSPSRKSDTTLSAKTSAKTSAKSSTRNTNASVSARSSLGGGGAGQISSRLTPSQQSEDKKTVTSVIKTQNQQTQQQNQSQTQTGTQSNHESSVKVTKSILRTSDQGILTSRNSGRETVQQQTSEINLGRETVNKGPSLSSTQTSSGPSDRTTNLVVSKNSSILDVSDNVVVKKSEFVSNTNLSDIGGNNSRLSINRASSNQSISQSRVTIQTDKENETIEIASNKNSKNSSKSSYRASLLQGLKKSSRLSLGTSGSQSARGSRSSNTTTPRPQSTSKIPTPRRESAQSTSIVQSTSQVQPSNNIVKQYSSHSITGRITNIASQRRNYSNSQVSQVSGQVSQISMTGRGTSRITGTNLNAPSLRGSLGKNLKQSSNSNDNLISDSGNYNVIIPNTKSSESISGLTDISSQNTASSADIMSLPSGHSINNINNMDSISQTRNISNTSLSTRHSRGDLLGRDTTQSSVVGVNYQKPRMLPCKASYTGQGGGVSNKIGRKTDPTNNNTKMIHGVNHNGTAKQTFNRLVNQNLNQGREIRNAEIEARLTADVCAFPTEVLEEQKMRSPTQTQTLTTISQDKTQNFPKTKFNHHHSVNIAKYGDEELVQRPHGIPGPHNLYWKAPSKEEILNMKQEIQEISYQSNSLNNKVNKVVTVNKDVTENNNQIPKSKISGASNQSGRGSTDLLGERYSWKSGKPSKRFTAGSVPVETVTVKTNSDENQTVTESESQSNTKTTVVAESDSHSDPVPTAVTTAATTTLLESPTPVTATVSKPPPTPPKSWQNYPKDSFDLSLSTAIEKHNRLFHAVDSYSTDNKIGGDDVYNWLVTPFEYFSGKYQKEDTEYLVGEFKKKMMMNNDQEDEDESTKEFESSNSISESEEIQVNTDSSDINASEQSSVPKQYITSPHAFNQAIEQKFELVSKGLSESELQQIVYGLLASDTADIESRLKEEKSESDEELEILDSSKETTKSPQPEAAVEENCSSESKTSNVNDVDVDHDHVKSDSDSKLNSSGKDDEDEKKTKDESLDSTTDNEKLNVEGTTTSTSTSTDTVTALTSKQLLEVIRKLDPTCLTTRQAEEWIGLSKVDEEGIDLREQMSRLMRIY